LMMMTVLRRGMGKRGSKGKVKAEVEVFCHRVVKKKEVVGEVFSRRVVKRKSKKTRMVAFPEVTTTSRDRQKVLKEALARELLAFEVKNPLVQHVFYAYRHVGDLSMAGKLMDFATCYGLEDASEQAFLEKHPEWLRALMVLMGDLSRAVDFMARVTNTNLKIEA
jgi:hypothetical protein